MGETNSIGGRSWGRRHAASRLEFLRALYGEEAPGGLVLWWKKGKRSRWIAASALHEAATIQEEDDLYFGVALQDQERALALAATEDPTQTRGRKESTVALPGVWADIDVQGPAHARDDLPPSFAAAHELIASFPLPSSVIVHSGHGLQAYWLFKEPWTFEDESERQQAETLSRRFQATLRTFAHEHGWTIDNTSDLARVLRLPGTFNTKLGERRPVEVVRWHPERRFDPSELEPYLVDATKTSRAKPSANGDGPPADLEAILEGCAWMRHCHADRRELPEPEWYAALSILGRSSRDSADGRTLAHEWSEDYPGYSAGETDRKLGQALEASGPRTCAYIADQLGARQPFCGDCPHFEKITSPIALGRGPGAQRSDGKPERRIVLVGPDEKRVNDEALEALAGRPDLYTRGSLLVRVFRDEETEHRIRKPENAPRIVPIPNAVLRELLAESVDFRKVTAKGELVPVSPPGSSVRALAARGHWPQLRPLEAVAQTPLLLPNGSVLQEPGYDRATGIYFLPRVEFPAVPDRPTGSEIEAALNLLREAVCDFPFAHERHVSAFLAAVLTILSRHAFSGPAPLVLVDANTRGSGKGLLVDVACRIGTGQDVARMAYSRNEDEQRKAILALALEGHRVALIDNVAGSFGSATLDAALTATVWTDRILGASKTATVPLSIVWFATGNNLAIVGDTVRRCLYIRLESPDEHPERRQGFRHPRLLEWVESRRAELIAAGLTLLRAYIAAGRPDQHLSSWGSFEAGPTSCAAASSGSTCPTPARPDGTSTTPLPARTRPSTTWSPGSRRSSRSSTAGAGRRGRSSRCCRADPRLGSADFGTPWPRSYPDQTKDTCPAPRNWARSSSGTEVESWPAASSNTLARARPSAASCGVYRPARVTRVTQVTQIPAIFFRTALRLDTREAEQNPRTAGGEVRHPRHPRHPGPTRKGPSDGRSDERRGDPRRAGGALDRGRHRRPGPPAGRPPRGPSSRAGGGDP